MRLFARLVTALAVGVALAPPASAATRALLVGVSEYRNLPKDKHLAGPRNDVLEMHDLLVSRGVPKSAITVLADHLPSGPKFPKSRSEPTRQAILQALADLIKDSKPGDQAIVYLSGHGSLQPKEVDDGTGAWRQVFLPIDVETKSPEPGTSTIKQGVRGDELGKFATDIRRRGAHLWFILDSCFSGAGLRGVGMSRSKYVSPDLLGIGQAPDPTRAQPLLERAPQAALRGRGIYFFASQGSEVSDEILLPLTVSNKSGTWRSAFTHALATTLARNPSLTYAELLDYTTRYLRADSGLRRAQTPLLEGDRDDPVIGSGPRSRVAQWPVERETVRAGTLHGLDKGAIIALFEKPDAKETDTPIGYGEILEAAPTEAAFMSIRYPCTIENAERQCVQAGSVSRARVARLVEPAVELFVQVSPPRPGKDAPPQLVALAGKVFAALQAASPELKGRVRFEAAAPDLVWWVNAKGFRIAPTGLEPSDISDGAAMAVTGSEQADDLAKRTERLLLRARQIMMLRRLAVGDGAPAVETRLSFVRGTYEANKEACRFDRAGAGAAVAADSLERVATPCMAVHVEVKNIGNTPRFINVVRVNDDWTVDPVWPPRCQDGGTIVEPGGTRRMSFNPGTPVIDPPIDTGAASPHARYSLVVLSKPRLGGTQPPDYCFLHDLNHLEATRGAAEDLLVGRTVATRRLRAGQTTTVDLIGWEVDRRELK